MKDRELNMLENTRKVLDISYPKEPFKNIEALSLVFENIVKFLRRVNRFIENGNIQVLRNLKNQKPYKQTSDRHIMNILRNYGLDERLVCSACDLYADMFIDIRDWGVSVITKEINELLKEENEEDLCQSN
jgi:hypothetical protein